MAKVKAKSKSAQNQPKSVKFCPQCRSTEVMVASYWNSVMGLIDGCRSCGFQGTFPEADAGVLEKLKKAAISQKKNKSKPKTKKKPKKSKKEPK